MKAKPPQEEKLPKRNTKTSKWLQLQQGNIWVVTGYFLREEGLACTEAAKNCVRKSGKPSESQRCSRGLWEAKAPGSVTPNPPCKPRWSHCRDGSSCQERSWGAARLLGSQGSSAPQGPRRRRVLQEVRLSSCTCRGSQRGWKAKTTP